MLIEILKAIKAKCKSIECGTCPIYTGTPGCALDSWPPDWKLEKLEKTVRLEEPR